MPELPEVETIKRSLDKYIKGQKIRKIEIRVPKLFQGDKADVIGQKIVEIERRAKMLIWKLSNNKYLLFHLKMTGQLLYVQEKELGTRHLGTSSRSPVPAINQSLVPSTQSPAEGLVAGGGHPDKVYLQQPPHQFTHIIFTLDRGYLYFNDLRKFGWVKVLSEQQLKDEVAKLGPEIDWPEFSLAYFQKALMRRQRSKIKTVLIDQTILTGVGNIYSDETLFVAKILPTRPVESLNEAELKRIYNALPLVINIAIKHGGTSLKDYRKLDGSMGDYLKYASVYHRTNEPCRVCKTPIKRQVINSRSSHFCPNCQK